MLKALSKVLNVFHILNTEMRKWKRYLFAFVQRKQTILRRLPKQMRRKGELPELKLL